MLGYISLANTEPVQSVAIPTYSISDTNFGIALNFSCPSFQNDCQLTDVVKTQPETPGCLIFDSIVIQFNPVLIFTAFLLKGHNLLNFLRGLMVKILPVLSHPFWPHVQPIVSS